MRVKDDIRQKAKGFADLCKKHNVRSLYAFGSSVTDNFNEETSDIDLLIDIDENDPIQRGEKLISIWDKLEVFFKRKVDLLTDSSIRNPILRNSINATKILLYDGTGQKVLV